MDEYAVHTVTFLKGAILAGVAMLALGPLAEPQFVRFRLADGVQVVGHMTSWDAEGFDGSFGRRLWTEITIRDVWRLYVQVMDQSEAGQWVDLGGVLLLMEDGESWAERALSRAVRLDEAVADQIESVRRAARETHRLREELEQAVQAQRLEARSPEAGPWPAEPWPAPAPGEQEAAVEAVRQETTQILRSAGIQLEPVETDHFLLYADLPALERARLAARLEAGYAQLAELFWLAETDSLFRGKAVVLYFADSDRFRLVEAESFGQVVPRGMLGICHPVGPRVFINLTGGTESDAFRAAAARETVHGFMHRYRAPVRLPPWANEGLAQYVAARQAPGRAAERQRRRALEFIRSGGDVAAVVGATYDEGWPGAGGIGPAVGGLLVELMITQGSPAFRAWVNAVKDGTDWSPALADHYGVPLPALLATFTQYYKVND